MLCTSKLTKKRFLRSRTKLFCRWFPTLVSSFSSAVHTARHISVLSLLISAGGYREVAGDTLNLEICNCTDRKKSLFVDRWLPSTTALFNDTKHVEASSLSMFVGRFLLIKKQSLEAQPDVSIIRGSNERQDLERAKLWRNSISCLRKIPLLLELN